MSQFSIFNAPVYSANKSLFAQNPSILGRSIRRTSRPIYNYEHKIESDKMFENENGIKMNEKQNFQDSIYCRDDDMLITSSPTYLF